MFTTATRTTLTVLVLTISVGLKGVNAQITSNATCQVGFDRLFNSRGQSPCLVSAYLGGVCNGGQYDVSALGPSQHYIGPTPDIADECQCNTVMYSVMAGCSSCQNASVITWSSWSESCSQVAVGFFPRNIPANTGVPAWAFQDVTTTDTFDLNAALANSAPESSATQSQVTQTGAPTNTNTGSGNPTNTNNPGSGSGSSNGNGGGGGSNTGAIVGGVIGGIGGLAIIAGIVFFVMRRQREKAKAAQGTQVIGGGSGIGGAGDNGIGNGNGSPYMAQAASPLVPGMTGATGATGMSSGGGGYSDVPYSPTPVSAYGHQQQQRLYDPNDPATFPSSPAPPTFHSQYTAVPQMPVPQQGYAPMQPQPQVGMYRGAPEV